MPKPKISSKFVDARTLAIHELNGFIDYVHTVDSKLNIDQVTLLAAFALHDLPQLFQINPGLLHQLKLSARDIRKKRKCDPRVGGKPRAPIVDEVRLSGGGDDQ